MQLDHVQIAAPPGCEPEARRFFGDLLGLTEVAKPPGLAGRGGVWFALGDRQLHIGVEEPFSPALKAHPALRASPGELDALADRLAAAGASVAWDDALAGERRFYTEDPWGNRLELLGAEHPTRRSQSANSRQYDRVARLYSTLEPLYLIFPPARRRAVAALGLKPGDTVLEIGAGTGRNFPYLVDAVGPSGTVIGVDASAGMLAEARRLIGRRRWPNVRLLHQDATQLEIDRDVDGVLFSLSYSALPEPRPALARGWKRLRPGGRVVVMDMGLTQSRWHRLLDPVARLLVKLGPGDAYSDPWRDLAAYGPVETKRFLADFYYVSFVAKPES